MLAAQAVDECVDFNDDSRLTQDVQVGVYGLPAQAVGRVLHDTLEPGGQVGLAEGVAQHRLAPEPALLLAGVGLHAAAQHAATWRRHHNIIL